MTNNVVLLRVGIDSGSGGSQSPLFDDGTFEYLPIPDGHGLDARTFGTHIGRHGRRLADYFPSGQRARIERQSMHFDPSSRRSRTATLARTSAAC